MQFTEDPPATRDGVPARFWRATHCAGGRELKWYCVVKLALVCAVPRWLAVLFFVCLLRMREAYLTHEPQPFIYFQF